MKVPAPLQAAASRQAYREDLQVLNMDRINWNVVSQRRGELDLCEAAAGKNLRIQPALRW